MVYIIYRNVLTGFGGTYWAIASEKFKNVKSALKYLESEELGTSFIAKQAKTGNFVLLVQSVCLLKHYLTIELT
jgi:hypothetical protein